jgi:hypothetical protein
MFQLTPDNELPTEGPSPSACWKKLFLKLQKVKEKSGKCFFGPGHKKHRPWRWGTAMLGFSNSQVLKAHPEIAKCESLHKVHKLAGQVTCASNNHHCSLACWLQTCDCLMEALGSLHRLLS